MSDNRNENWQDYFPENPAEGKESGSTMSDEELAQYLARLIPDENEPVPDAAPAQPPAEMPITEDTMVTDLHIEPEPEPLPTTDEATNIIPDDIKSIYNSGRHRTLPPEETERYEPQAEEEEEYYEKRDFRPVRRRRHRRFGCMGGVMYFLFILCISIALAAFGWIAANDVLALNKPFHEATIEIPEDFDIDYVANELKRNGIINYKFLFKLYASFSDVEENIDPGVYTLSTELDYWALVTAMQEGSTELIVEVTLTEGMTAEEIFAKLEENDICSVAELEDAAKNYDFDYDFLDGLPLGDSRRLEGYLFPDTYQFYVDSEPQTAISRLLDNYESKVTDEMYRLAENRGYTMREILTVASLIEKEAGSNDERATIASVIYNRLESDFPYLQIDASIQYILEERKENLSNDDLLIDDPYNTYMYEGLPPGPICNPSLASIRAALEPEDTDYYYYALNREGTHNFFETYDEHQAFTESEEYGG